MNLWITPAHAGRSDLFALNLTKFKDHPRACGEKHFAMQQIVLPKGSPPRMRGEGLSRRARGFYHGITPAHAGRRQYDRPPAAAGEDHPRACGEKRSYCRRQSRGSGITPAHAGRSDRRRVRGNAQKDHPRACGEKGRTQVREISILGSPPRMRGEGSMGLNITRILGITPAHAGRSVNPHGSKGSGQDHPRACGEKTKKIPYHRLFPLRSAPFSFSFA